MSPQPFVIVGAFQKDMPDEPDEMLAASWVPFDEFMLYPPVFYRIRQMSLQRGHPTLLQCVEFRMPDMCGFMIDIAVHEPKQIRSSF